MRSFTRALVHAPGVASRIEASHFRRAVGKSETINSLLTRYHMAQMCQVMQCGAVHDCCWLLPIANVEGIAEFVTGMSNCVTERALASSDLPCPPEGQTATFTIPSIPGTQYSIEGRCSSFPSISRPACPPKFDRMPG